MTPTQLIASEFKKMGIAFDIESIQSENRFAEQIFLRRVVCDILNKAGYSYNEIGRFINRNHSSVIHMLEHTPDWDKATVIHNQIRYHERQLKSLRIKLLST